MKFNVSYYLTSIYIVGRGLSLLVFMQDNNSDAGHTTWGQLGNMKENKEQIIHDTLEHTVALTQWIECYYLHMQNMGS